MLTPPDTHLDIVQRAARAGKQVLVEKPLELDLECATALVQTCEAAGVTLAVMRQHCLREAARGLKTLLDAGELGELVSAEASVRCGGRNAITTNRDVTRSPAKAAAAC